MAPEQAKGDSGKVDRRSDIFLLGATLYSIVTYSAPFDLEDESGTDEDLYRIMEKAENCDFIRPSQRNPRVTVSEELEEIIMKAMSENPDDRYQSVEELSRDIDLLLEGRMQSIKRTFSPGDIIVKENTYGDEAYVITKGKVEVFKSNNGEKLVIGTLEAGDCFGEMALIDRSQRSATVVAEVDTEVIVITSDSMNHGLDKLPDWLAKMMKAMTDRLRSASENLHPLSKKDPSFHILNQLSLICPAYGQSEKTNGYSINFNSAVKEISVHLSIPEENAERVILALLETDFADKEGELIFIRDYEQYKNFVEYISYKNGIKTDFTNSSSEDKQDSFEEAYLKLQKFI